MLRAAALFGVLLVNMEVHRGPALYQDLAAVSEEGRSTADSVAVFLIDWLGQGKAYTVLAFLFGYGAHLIFVRAQAAGVAIGPLFARRLAGLAVLGVLHTVLLFWGDVLLPYAVSGTALLLAFRAGDLTLLTWAVGLVLALVLVVTSAAFVLPPISAEDQDAYFISAADARHGYISGVGATIEQHVRDAAYAFSGFVASVPQTIALFFVGVVAARHRLVEDRERHAALWRRTALIGLGAGLPLNLLLAVLFHDGGPTSTVAFGFATLLFMTAPFVLAAGYLALGVLFAERLRVLAPLGRVSLTAYLLQSAAVAVVFTSYGLERYGSEGAAFGLALTLAVFAAEVALAHLWLRRHTQGPVERLLRACTYRSRFSPK